jgi:hypothetical protein
MAPLLAVLFAWGVDQLLAAHRLYRIGAWFMPNWPVTPLVGIHPSLLGWLGAAFGAVLVAWLLSDRRLTSLLIASSLTFPLGFGTLRDAARWAAAPDVSHALSLVPVCAAGEGDADGAAHVVFGSTRFRPVSAPVLVLPRAKVRWESSPDGRMLIRVDAASHEALAAHSWSRVTSPDPGCNSSAIVVDGRTHVVARMDAVLLWGTMAIDDSEIARLRGLFEALTSAEP